MLAGNKAYIVGVSAAVRETQSDERQLVLHRE